MYKRYCHLKKSKRYAAAVMSLKPQKGPVNGSLYTEEDWNTESTLETAPYPFSKVWLASDRLSPGPIAKDGWGMNVKQRGVMKIRPVYLNTGGC